jgi:hypothetical protein
MQRPMPERTLCPECGEPIGVYEPLWRIAPDIGAERTSWLRLSQRAATIETLRHMTCAETEGVTGAWPDQSRRLTRAVMARLTVVHAARTG